MLMLAPPEPSQGLSEHVGELAGKLKASGETDKAGYPARTWQAEAGLTGTALCTPKCSLGKGVQGLVGRAPGRGGTAWAEAGGTGGRPWR